ncbi:WPP domain-interacting protein 1-like [Salvia miltiorrhiza]|uniref:WPP domain-interacting protein 1-like n=1 Tax=Salvia miltiorrhiza TaxID=226208 RepID=UPI0025AC8CB1|nr:WPP domain-interacting protein 1-like [Salvia miltiorrhiza]
MESDCWVRESVEDNEGIANDSISDKLGTTSESKVQINGSCAVEDSDRNELNLKGAHVELKPKGYGLKKWRRIRRDANRDGDSSTDTGNALAQESPRGGGNPSKRVQYAERKQKSEGSVSSTNAVVKTFDGYALLDDSSLGASPSFAAGTDSENSEDRSSKSSTAASAPKMIGGFPRDKSKMSSFNGKNLMHAVQFGQHGKGRTENSKKARGERVKIEKENSHSSVESDSRSSNFVFMQGTFSVNNGIRSEGANEYDGENGDEVQGIGKQVNDGLRSGYGKGGRGGSPEDVVADSSWAEKEERSENHGPMRDKDPLSESMRALQSAHEALEAEVLKFKEIGSDVSVDGPVSDLCNEYIDVEQKLEETSDEGSQSKVIQSENSAAVAELEDIFKQKVEAEVEYLAISRTVQKMRVAAVEQITVLEEQKDLSSVQAQVLTELGDAENKAASLKKRAEKLENFCEDNESADEILKLQKGACKYGSCFVMQLVLLVVIWGVFILQFSQDYVEVVPT